MTSDIHPAARRITWLMIVIGAGAILVAVAYFLLNLGPGVTLPFTKSALDTGWLAIFGLLWLVSGVLLLWWLRPGQARTAEIEPLPNNQIEKIETRLRALESQLGKVENLENLTTRLNALDITIQNLKTRFDAKATGAAKTEKSTSNSNGEAQNHVLDHELDNLGTAIQDVSKRLDNLDDAANRLHDVESQLDALYVTLHDAHQRIDSLEQLANR